MMETKVFEEKDINEVAKALKAGEVISFATETVYGVGVISSSEEAFKRLAATKRRPPEKPFTMMLANPKDAGNHAIIDAKAQRIMERFMPGEITVLLKARPNLDPWITMGLETIGIRVPDSKFVRDLIEKTGEPLLVTSANHSGEATAKSFEEAYAALNGEIYGVVKGVCHSQKASTIVNLSKEGEITLVREGGIPFEDIKNAWEEDS